MKRETELVHDHLNLMHRFLTSFDMRDTCISETAKLSLSDIPSTELPGLSDLKEAKLHTNYPIFVLLKLKDEMWPKPTDYTIERVKTQKKEKNKVRKDNKKTQMVVHLTKQTFLLMLKIHKNMNSYPLIIFFIIAKFIIQPLSQFVQTLDIFLAVTLRTIIWEITITDFWYFTNRIVLLKRDLFRF